MPYHDPFNGDLPFNFASFRQSQGQPHEHVWDDGQAPAAMRSFQQAPSHPSQSHTQDPTISTTNHPDNISSTFFDHASAARVNTDVHMYEAIKAAHPNLEIIDTDPRNVNIIGYVSATGDGTIIPITSPTQTTTSSGNKHSTPTSLTWTSYLPRHRRLSGGNGTLTTQPIFAKFLLKWHDVEFLIYILDARDGTEWISMKRQYILTSDPGAAYALMKTVGSYQNELHNEIWVFDQGYWQKDPSLYASIQKSSWKDIILPEDLKEDLLDTVLRFYDSHETYRRLRVPWKRGLIFYGPPGNGKTVSIKATMKTLYDRSEPIPTLYVKSLSSFAGPEYSISSIFAKARREAPCYLVFEDLDSLVTDDVRSFFLNAVDGLSENEGILMVGSTNHLERLDPGIAKRPSRFDRKYLFPDPDVDSREKYCQYWQGKLKDNEDKDVEFPDGLVGPMARLMGGFSFAYMQEAFKRHEEKEREQAWDMVEMGEELVGADNGNGGDEDLDKYKLWREFKVQVANLKKELDKGTD
ncbi:hypothetical protein PMZ80_009415 [Knufia obscura]|uniref:ATPase AAA-type core domain-containing protein n=1 Tax=Knufia obscura TaxID=1635080 RepID=A0ABR0RCT1_9EURO|nr:hypothetical protein PMZ80_009415 [Knufia obscura]